MQRLVVVPELPSIPATLFLRLLGRGEALRAALHEVLSLPVDHPLGRSIAAHLGPFRETFVGLGLLPQLHSWEDTMLISELLTPDVIKAYDARMEREREVIRQRALEEGLREGREEGREEGHQEGHQEVLARLCCRTLGRALSVAERAGLARRLKSEGLEVTMEAVLDRAAPALEAWLSGVAG